MDPRWGIDNFIWGDSDLIWGQVTDDETQNNVSTGIFSTPELAVTTNQLAQHLPDGRAWVSKYIEGSNMRGLVRSVAASFNRVQQQIEALANEFNIPLTTDLLPEWEASVGLPDECITQAETLQERRDAVISRLRRLPIVTQEDFQNLGQELTGVPTTVLPGIEVDTVVVKETRFRMYVSFPTLSESFPYDFAFPFGSFRPDIVTCVFRQVAPANVIVLLA